MYRFWYDYEKQKYREKGYMDTDMSYISMHT